MSITGAIAAVITLVVSDGFNIPGAIAAYSIGPGVGGLELGPAEREAG